MRHRTLIAVVLGVCVLPAGYLAGRRDWVPDTPGPSEPETGERVQPANGDAEPTSVIPGAPSVELAVDDVRAMSETFRHSTLLVAIRRAGFYCDDVVSASESVEGAWLATCADRSGYIVSVRDIDEFYVHPILHLFDGVGPALIGP
jgi:hypothetical protein